MANDPTAGGAIKTVSTANRYDRTAEILQLEQNYLGNGPCAACISEGEFTTTNCINVGSIDVPIKLDGKYGRTSGNGWVAVGGISYKISLNGSIGALKPYTYGTPSGKQQLKDIIDFVTPTNTLTLSECGVFLDQLFVGMQEHEGLIKETLMQYDSLAALAFRNKDFVSQDMVDFLTLKSSFWKNTTYGSKTRTLKVNIAIKPTVCKACGTSSSNSPYTLKIDKEKCLQFLIEFDSASSYQFYIPNTSPDEYIEHFSGIVATAYEARWVDNSISTLVPQNSFTSQTANAITTALENAVKNPGVFSVQGFSINAQVTTNVQVGVEYDPKTKENYIGIAVTLSEGDNLPKIGLKLVGSGNPAAAASQFYNTMSALWKQPTYADSNITNLQSSTISNTPTTSDGTAGSNANLGGTITTPNPTRAETQQSPAANDGTRGGWVVTPGNLTADRRQREQR